MLQEENYILVDSDESLKKLLDDLELYDMAAVDTEADSMHHYHSKLCLIQITIGEHHYIVDPLSGLDLKPLFKARAMQTLIFHGADYDLRLLWQRYEFSPKHIFDTMLAAKILGEKKLGLADLVAKYFGDTLKKENQKADWTIRPLSHEMCEYAIHDTFYLHELCALLAEKLIEMGRMNWLTEECNLLLEHSKIPHEKTREPWQITGSYVLDSCSLNILKHLWEWRENLAETWDRPAFKVMAPDLMLSIVRRLRTHFPEVNKSLLPRLPRNIRDTYLEELLVALKTAVEIPEKFWPQKMQKPIPPSIVPHSDLLAALKEWRDKKANALGIEPTLIANRSQLNQLAMPGDTSWETRFENAHLMNFQRQLWIEILQEYLPHAKRIGDTE